MPNLPALDLLKGQDAPAARAWLAAHPDARVDVGTLVQAVRRPARDMVVTLWPHSSNRVRHAAARRCVKEGDTVGRDRLLELGGQPLRKALAEWGAKEGRLDVLHLALEGMLTARCFTQAVDRRQWSYVRALIERVDVRPTFRCLTIASQAHVFERLISAPGLAPLVQQLLDTTRPAAWAKACCSCTGKSKPNADTIRAFMTHPSAPAESLAWAMLGLAREEPGFIPLLHEMGVKLARTSLWQHVPAACLVPEESRLKAIDLVGTVAPAAVRRDWLAQWGEALPRSRQVEQTAIRHAQGADQAPQTRRHRIRA